jgi:hypothetical protein
MLLYLSSYAMRVGVRKRHSAQLCEDVRFNANACY